MVENTCLMLITLNTCVKCYLWQYDLACSRLRDSGEKSFSKKKWEKRAGAGERQGHRPLSQVARFLFSLCSFNTSPLYYLKARHRLNTIIKCTILQLNSSVATYKQLSPGLADTYEVKISAYSSTMHKTWSFYNICFSIEQKMRNYETKSLD